MRSFCHARISYTADKGQESPTPLRAWFYGRSAQKPRQGAFNNFLMNAARYASFRRHSTAERWFFCDLDLGIKRR
jgi:hypothetical protein